MFLPAGDGCVDRPALAAAGIEPQRMWRITCDLPLDSSPGTSTVPPRCSWTDLQTITPN